MNAYQAVAIKKPLALTGSRGYLEIAMNQGSARAFFKAEKGDPVRVEKK